MEFLINFLTAGAGGGILGLIGSAVSSFFKIRQARIEMEKQQQAYEHEVKLQQLQMQARAEETEQELMLASSRGAWEGLEQSYRAMIPSGDVSRWANNVRSMVRPALTFLLLGATVFIVWYLIATIRGAAVESLFAQVFSYEEMIELLVYSIQSVVFATVTAVVWWFGDRASLPPGLKGR